MSDQPHHYTQPQPQAPKADSAVAVLGAGIMGAAMARNLLAAGLPTTVWDRDPAATTPLQAAGATAAATPAEAASQAQVVITMLPTADITAGVVFDSKAADALPSATVWAQMGTIGVPQTTELAARLARHRPDVTYLDAPVSGSKGPAESGQLLILASGPTRAQPVVAPVFEAIGRKTLWLGDTGMGSRMKLVVNAYLSMLIEGVAETLALARHLDIDIAHLNAAIEGGPLDAPLADAKLHKMESADFAPEFPLEWALKDVDLAIHSADTTPLPLLAALSHQWHDALNAGHGRQDISAAILALNGDT